MVNSSRNKHSPEEIRRIDIIVCSMEQYRDLYNCNEDQYERETFAVLLSTRRIRFLWERFEISKKLTTLFLQGKTGLLRYT